MTVLFKHNPEVACSHGQREDLTVAEFVEYNIYNTASLAHCFSKYSSLNDEQKQELKNYLLSFKNGQIPGYDKNLEKWVKSAQEKGII